MYQVIFVTFKIIECVASSYSTRTIVKLNFCDHRPSWKFLRALKRQYQMQVSQTHFLMRWRETRTQKKGYLTTISQAKIPIALTYSNTQGQQSYQEHTASRMKDFKVALSTRVIAVETMEVVLGKDFKSLKNQKLCLFETLFAAEIIA